MSNTDTLLPKNFNSSIQSGPKVVIPEDHIQIILHLVQQNEKSQAELILLGELLKPISPMQNLLKELSQEAILDFFSELRYESANIFQPIISHGDPLKKFCILIKGCALQLTRSTNVNTKVSGDMSPYFKKFQTSNSSANKTPRDSLKTVDSPLLNKNLSNQESEKSKVGKSTFSSENTSNMQKSGCSTPKNTFIQQNRPERKFSLFCNGIEKEIQPVSNPNSEQKVSNFRSSTLDIHSIVRHFKGLEDSKDSLGASPSFLSRRGHNTTISLNKNLQYSSIEEWVSINYPQMIITGKLYSGDQFGLDNSNKITQSKTTILATTNCDIIYIRFSAYKRIVGDFFAKQAEERKKILLQNPIFQGMSSEVIDIFRREWHTVIYPRNHVIFKEGDFADNIFIILNGEIEVSLLVNEIKDQEEAPQKQLSQIHKQIIALNNIWNKNSSSQKRIRVAYLMPYQILGDDAILHSDTRFTKAIVSSCSAELYPIPVNKILPFINDEEFEEKFGVLSYKEYYREKMAHDFFKAHESVEEKVNNLQNQIIPKQSRSVCVEKNDSSIFTRNKVLLSHDITKKISANNKRKKSKNKITSPKSDNNDPMYKNHQFLISERANSTNIIDSLNRIKSVKSNLYAKFMNVRPSNSLIFGTERKMSEMQIASPSMLITSISPKIQANSLHHPGSQCSDRNSQQFGAFFTERLSLPTLNNLEKQFFSDYDLASPQESLKDLDKKSKIFFPTACLNAETQKSGLSSSRQHFLGSLLKKHSKQQ